MRAVLRNPDLLILDEATANIDTITEQILQDILNKLPATTTRVIIAHRLNTIQNADEIFFVNAGEIIRAGSFDHAVDMLLHGERKAKKICTGLLLYQEVFPRLFREERSGSHVCAGIFQLAKYN